MRQKAAITFEVEETVVLKQGARITSEHCPRCCQAVEMFPPAILALVAGISELEIFRLIESGDVHFAETERLTVCLNCYRRSIVGDIDHANEGFEN